MKKIVILCLSVFVMVSCAGLGTSGSSNSTKFQCGDIIVKEQSNGSIFVTYPNGKTYTYYNPSIIQDMSTGDVRRAFLYEDLFYIDVAKKDGTHERTVRHGGGTYVCEPVQ